MIRWLRTSVWPKVQKTLQGWQDDDGGLLSASMAYYALLSLFPLLLILISVLGFVLRFSPGAQDAQRQLLELLAQNTSPSVADNVGLLLGEVRVKATVGGPLGLGALLLAAIGIFTQLERAFDRIWKVKSPGTRGILAAIRHALIHRIRAFLMLSGVGLLLVAALAGGIAISAARSWAVGLPYGTLLWRVVEILLSVWLSWLLFALIYKAIPRTRVLWNDAVRGGAVAAVLWEINRQVLAALVIGEKYSAYGIVGSIIVLMLWVYLASNILFLGAEYIQVVRSEREAGAKQRSELP